jgi:hypothetical protein
MKYGEVYPTGLYLGMALSKYWTTYADGAVFLNDSSQSIACAGENNACGNISYHRNKFTPWEFLLITAGAYSFEKYFTIRALSEISFYSKEFPTYQEGDKDPHGNLYLMFYRLGISRMPGYPYNFRYNGRDILKGTALAHGRLSLDIPYKLRWFIDSPWFPFSSLNQVKLSLMSNIGTTLNEVPDRIITALNKGEHEILFDFGVQFSLNFQIFHRIPMTIFVRAFKPVNMLKEQMILRKDLPPIDWNGDGFTERHTFTGYSAGRDYDVGVKEYLKNLNSTKYYFGLTLGRF